MPEINVLPKNIFELIAAGEVVERPASVIKELVENSIDAGADKITVEIKRGGNAYIRVTDNGCGIDRKNIKKAFMSHATSKIKNAQDLDAIYTLGFRGEALSSLAAVAKVEVMTKVKDDESGTRYVIEGGEEVLIDEAGCPDGMTIVVRDLFFNTPARMKFLKKDSTEGNAVAGVVEKIALSHPEISFRFIKEDVQVLITQGNSELSGVIYSVLGKDFYSSLIPCEYELDSIKVSGYISKPVYSRPNRSMQFFFLNGRLIKTKTGMAAIEQAYKNSIMTGKFPACVLFIEMSAAGVDVNVHPSKTEVRFANESAVFNAVYYCVKSALGKGDSRPSMSFNEKSKLKAAQQFLKQAQSGVQTVIDESIPQRNNDFWQSGKKADINMAENKNHSEFRQNEKAYFQKEESYDFLSEKYKNNIKNSDEAVNKNQEKTDAKKEVISQNETDESKPYTDKNNFEKITASNEKSEEQPTQKIEPFRIIGEAFKTYIIVEQSNKLLLIDKHAAHERIIFEEIKSNADNIETQMLIVPVTVTLSAEEFDAVMKNTDMLEQAGYSVGDFGGRMVAVSSCPTYIDADDIENEISELAHYLALNNKNLTTEKLDWIYHSTACRAAIKAGDNTTEYELEKFVEKLFGNPQIRYCPHGRPVMMEISKYEIEKNFGRV